MESNSAFEMNGKDITIMRTVTFVSEKYNVEMI